MRVVIIPLQGGLLIDSETMRRHHYSVTESSNPPPTEVLQSGGVDADNFFDLAPDLGEKSNLQLSGTKDGIDPGVYHTDGPGTASFRIKGNGNSKELSDESGGPGAPTGEELVVRLHVTQDSVPAGGSYTIQARSPLYRRHRGRVSPMRCPLEQM